MHVGAQELRKIVAVAVGLEADEIIGEHRLDEVAVLRQARHDAAVRPRRVQEEADFPLDAEFAQLRAERQEVIVVHPDGRVAPPKVASVRAMYAFTSQ